MPHHNSNNNSNSNRVVKRRAAKACSCCRGRKVRCDVVGAGIPCTNCRLDEVECLVSDTNRRYRTRRQVNRRDEAGDEELRRQQQHEEVEGIEEHEDEDQDAHPVPEDKSPPQFTIFDDIEGLRDINPPPGAALPPSTIPNYTHGHAPAATTQASVSSQPPRLKRRRYEEAPPIESSSADRPRSNQFSPNNMARADQVGGLVGGSERSDVQPAVSSVHTASPAQSSSQQPNLSHTALPNFIQPIRSGFSTTDLKYLHTKGAFTIPETNLRNQLLRCYAEFVHPYLPLLDLKDLLAAVEGNEGTRPVSLLLFQAAMFATIPYVDLRHLRANGYSTRRSARQAFFQRAKLLCDLDYELDRLTIIQSTLLMTYWFEKSDDPKGASHWLGMAISLSYAIGLNRDPSNASSLDLKQQRLRKRIWWSCIIRDRLIALALRRPVRIDAKEFNVPMLDSSDFETESLPLDLTKAMGDYPALRSPSVRRSLVSLCVGLTELCLCITQVLIVQYSSLGFSIGSGPEAQERLVPQQGAAAPWDTMRCDNELQQWYQDHAHEIQVVPIVAPRGVVNGDSKVIETHRAILKGLYLTAVSVLHRPQTLHPISGRVLDPELRELSRRKVRDAAEDITTLYRDLYTRGLVWYLPNTGVTCLLPALIFHLLQVKAGDASLNQMSYQKFKFCMKALDQLGQVYASAGFAFDFLNATAAKLIRTKPAGFEERSKAWGSHRQQQQMALEGEKQQVPAISDPSQRTNTQFPMPDFISDTASSRPLPTAGGNFEWDSSSNGETHNAWGGGMTKRDQQNGQRIADGFVAGAGMEEVAEADFQMAPNSWINLEGCEDFFTMTNGEGLDIDMQWLEALGEFRPE